MVGAFKSIVTVKYIQGVNNHGWVSFDDKFFHER
jgi:hypothetical protein